MQLNMKTRNRIKELARAGESCARIAEVLNSEGHKTAHGHQFKGHSVQNNLEAMRFNSKRTGFHPTRKRQNTTTIEAVASSPTEKASILLELLNSNLSRETKLKLLPHVEF